MASRRNTAVFLLLGAATALLLMLTLACGAVGIPLRDVAAALTGGDVSTDYYRVIVLEARLPMAIAALLSGAALSASGLMLQTTFQNPLAGPSVLGVSSGASLGVALLMLTGLGAIGAALPVIGALVGAGAVIIALTAFSRALRSQTMLLIAGIMVSYLASALITLLNFFAPATDVKMFAVWGMGSFSAVRLPQLPLFAGMTLILLLGAMLLVKPLDAMLLGERYAASMGIDTTRVRHRLLFVSGALTAVATAYCGPIGFIGLAVPHVARMLLRTSSHAVLMPATILAGGATALLCAWLAVIPSSLGVLPVNAITPLIGVPVIIYILLRRHRLRYFN